MPEDRLIARTVLAEAPIAIKSQERSAGSPTPIMCGPLSITGRGLQRTTGPGRVHALWRRVLAGFVVCDPDPRYSALDRLDGLRVGGSERAVSRIHAPVDGQ